MAAQGHFEAIKYALRQSKDGYVVSFVVHPDDVPDELSKSKIGTRYMVAFAEILDDGKPAPSIQKAPVATAEVRQKERKPFHHLPLSQQAALRCQDRNFQQWIISQTPDAFAPTAENAAIIVRDKCGVSSRSELNGNGVAADRWRALNEQFSRYEITQQYSDVLR